MLSPELAGKDERPLARRSRDLFVLSQGDKANMNHPSPFFSLANEPTYSVVGKDVCVCVQQKKKNSRAVGGHAHKL